MKVRLKECAEALDVGHWRNRGVKENFNNVDLHSWMNGAAVYLHQKALEGSRREGVYGLEVGDMQKLF